VAFPLTSPSGPITFPTRTFENAGGWRSGVFNRLEGPVVDADPRLSELFGRLARWVRLGSDGERGVADPPRGPWMTGSGAALFLVADDPSQARRLESALRAPRGPLSSFTAETGIAVETARVQPHPALFP